MPTKKTTPTKKTESKSVDKKPKTTKKEETKKTLAKPKAEKKPAEKKSLLKKILDIKPAAKKAVAKPVAKKTAEKKAAEKPKESKKVAGKVVVKKTTTKVATSKKAATKKTTTEDKKPAVKIVKEKAETTKKSVAKKTSKSAHKSPEIKVLVITNIGNIELSLEPEKAPITVANFLKYISIKHYDGLIFHRVIPDFMIQGGGYDEGLNQRSTLTAIRIESNNGLKNARGTVAMARTNDPNSATSQFFINLVDNYFLDFKEETENGFGYTVFGKVTKGIDIVDKVGSAPTAKYMHHENLPINVIRIETIKVI